MKYPISPESRRLLEDLAHLRTEAGALLHEASPAARDEWWKLESRFPSEEEIRRGFTAVSKPELEEMRSKVRRFRDILMRGRQGPQISRSIVERESAALASGSSYQHSPRQKPP
jgi:hypothetical protein